MQRPKFLRKTQSIPIQNKASCEIKSATAELIVVCWCPGWSLSRTTATACLVHSFHLLLWDLVLETHLQPDIAVWSMWCKKNWTCHAWSRHGELPGSHFVAHSLDTPNRASIAYHHQQPYTSSQQLQWKVARHTRRCSEKDRWHILAQIMSPAQTKYHHTLHGHIGFFSFCKRLQATTDTRKIRNTTWSFLATLQPEHIRKYFDYTSMRSVPNPSPLERCCIGIRGCRHKLIVVIGTDVAWWNLKCLNGFSNHVQSSFVGSPCSVNTQLFPTNVDRASCHW